MPWNPAQYLAFGDSRLRPALDLLARIPLENPATVLDLGCGPGNVTRILQQRWPRARITGVDNSAEMLARARADYPEIAWHQANLAGWQPPAGTELIYSNAALHWLDDHPRLFPRLVDSLAPGGVLAVQMPNNYAAPSHRCAYEAARAGPWRTVLEPLLRPEPLLTAEAYYDLLADRAQRVEIWQADYLQVLEGDNPVARWTRTSLLMPLLDALGEPWREAFEADYRRRVEAAYPRRADGKTLFPFRRLFLVAVK
jgi:trans-aconitate 2-methyltransferase